MRCESCPFPVHICVRKTRRCHSPAKGHFRGGTLVLSRLLPSRSSRLSCAMAWSSLPCSRVDSSIALAFFSCLQNAASILSSSWNPCPARVAQHKVCAARYERNRSVLLRTQTLSFSQKSDTRAEGRRVVARHRRSQAVSGAMQLVLLHAFGHAPHPPACSDAGAQRLPRAAREAMSAILLQADKVLVKAIEIASLRDLIPQKASEACSSEVAHYRERGHTGARPRCDDSGLDGAAGGR